MWDTKRGLENFFAAFFASFENRLLSNVPVSRIAIKYSQRTGKEQQHYKNFSSALLFALRSAILFFDRRGARRRLAPVFEDEDRRLRCAVFVW